MSLTHRIGASGAAHDGTTLHLGSSQANPVTEHEAFGEAWKIMAEAAARAAEVDGRSAEDRAQLLRYHRDACGTTPMAAVAEVAR